MDEAADIPSEFAEGPGDENPPGRDEQDMAMEPTASPSSPGQVPTSPMLVVDHVMSRPLTERMENAGAEEPIGVVIELRVAHPRGVSGALEELREMLAVIAPAVPMRWTRSYLVAALTQEQIRELVRLDGDRAHAHASADPQSARPAPRWAIYRIWPNFQVRPLIHRSVITTKCDAAHRAFGALGQGIVWAVMDSGIDANHPHFDRHQNLALPAGLVHRSFLAGVPDTEALKDASGHGTHVAGILAGEFVAPADQPIVAATWYEDDQGALAPQSLRLDRITGMAPRCKLLSCKVLRDDESGDVAAMLEALEYVMDLNHGGRELNVHGVNLSVGYPFDPSWFGAGLTPVCREVDRLVRSGTVVVIAAGNTGYGYALTSTRRQMRLGFNMTINDPGNTEIAITVGSTSTRPYLTGVSYFSSKGPTGDGRAKPDLVAPGERVVSAAAGKLQTDARRAADGALYVEDSGTSMACPHVSGVTAAFLSVHQEFIGRPDDVKRILLRTAGDLGRRRSFQGRGLVDAMRAIQAV